MWVEETCLHWVDKVVLIAWESFDAVKKSIESWEHTLVVVRRVWKDLLWTLSDEITVFANELKFVH